MSEVAPSADWTLAEGVPPGHRWIAILSPIALAFAVPLALWITGSAPLLGMVGIVALTAGLVVISGAVGVLFFNQMLVKGVRVSPSGVEVLTRYGACFTVPWSSSILRAARGSTGFGVLSYTWPSPGTRILTPAQYAAAKTGDLQLAAQNPTPSTNGSHPVAPFE
jgi:hypothetical protein